ncbi:hypothetical protein ON010_g6243 [Phytophthora cinnamomi]|nr:hypothetical protein ON010_g6243 [Phytophthora cinnamomi]
MINRRNETYPSGHRKARELSAHFWRAQTTITLEFAAHRAQQQQQRQQQTNDVGRRRRQRHKRTSLAATSAASGDKLKPRSRLVPSTNARQDAQPRQQQQRNASLGRRQTQDRRHLSPPGSVANVQAQDRDQPGRRRQLRRSGCTARNSCRRPLERPGRGQQADPEGRGASGPTHRSGSFRPSVLGLLQGRQGGGEEAAAREPRERRPRRRLPGRSQDHRDAQPPAPCALRGCRVDVCVGPVRGAGAHGRRRPALAAGQIRSRASRHRLQPTEDTDRNAHLQCAGLHALAVTAGDPQQPQVEERAAERNDGGQGDQLRHVTQADVQDVHREQERDSVDGPRGHPR